MQDLIFKDKLPSIESIETLYPKRQLKEGAMVTRFAPSPTGFLHIGGVYMALISERLGHQSDGIYYVRIEDTDQKRNIAGAKGVINRGLENFDLKPDEGSTLNGEIGSYGPYEQSKRSHLYNVFLKKLIKEGKVYPCFCTEEDLDNMRKVQTDMSVKPGYYGVWAKCRDLDISEVTRRIDSGMNYILRFRSDGDSNKKIVIRDLIKGDIEIPENDVDIVVMKADGLPTYHFAHAVDDHLMGTTHVIRADEWLSSTPLHYQLFDALGFEKLKYGHIFPINKIDEYGSKRKLSKRKDLEANVEYYQGKGYPNTAVMEYLMNLANSDFEEWRKQNPEKSYKECPLTFKKLSQSNGPLFNETKLRDISKTIISGMSIETLFDSVLIWSETYDKDFYNKLNKNKIFWIKVFGMERDLSKRKDIACWSETFEFYKYFDSETFNKPDWSKFTTPLILEEISNIIDETKSVISANLTRDDFMEFMRILAKRAGLAESIKEFKLSGGTLRGHVGLISQVIRFAITGLLNTPDLFQIIQILGEAEVKKRLSLKRGDRYYPKILQASDKKEEPYFL